MARSMADKQWDAAHRVAGDKVEEEIFIYSTSVENWTRIVIDPDITPIQDWINRYTAKGFDVRQENTVTFFASAPFKVGA